MRRQTAFVGIIELFCLIQGEQALPQEAQGNPHLEEARRLYHNLQYAEAVPELHLALARAGRDRDQLCEIYSLLGIVQLILGNSEEARRAFEQLLTLRPSFEIDRNLSPKIREFFAEVKAGFKPPVQVSFPDEPEVIFRKDGRIYLETPVEDVYYSAASIELWWSATGDEFQRLQMARTEKGDYSAELPFSRESLPPAGMELDFFLAARGEDGAVLAQKGSAENPLVLELRRPLAETPSTTWQEEASPPPARWYQKWWVWTLVGAAVAGAAVGAGVGLSGGAELPAGSLGEWKLNR